MDRNLDHNYFFIKRNNRYENVCFSDMTKQERYDAMSSQTKEEVMNLADSLAETIKTLGKFCNIIINRYKDDEEENAAW